VSRRKHGFFQDEQGDRSFSRLALATLMVNALLVLWCDVVFADVSEAAYDFMSDVSIALCTWAGARATMRYVGDRMKKPEQEGQ
jgi:hypothetical protein